MATTRKPAVLSLLRDEARRVFGEGYYIQHTRVTPYKLVAGNKDFEVSVFNTNAESTLETGYGQLLACLTALPDHGKKPKTCSFCFKPGHTRALCQELTELTQGRRRPG